MAAGFDFTEETYYQPQDNVRIITISSGTDCAEPCQSIEKPVKKHVFLSPLMKKLLARIEEK